MALAEKLEGNVELKSPAEKFYKVLKSENHHIPKACSDKVKSIEVHEGDWETPGPIKFWNYTVDGKAEIWKEKVEVDEANKKVTFVAVEGHVLDLYKTYKARSSRLREEWQK
ncbi:hypothetical protein L6164_016672 [Bauhinia variegata]|uniref:Uncharacterized protein n=1 Tax=Bauhinia variegata TaxID=167791 RepID=A0ACB9NQ36_BAUVA|nr:hypothetical protein L6164_016672 [Bauhinia variegata]